METRVEKYKNLRAQIQFDGDEVLSTKAKTSKKVDDIFNASDSENVENLKNSTISISYNDLMEAYDLYDHKKPKKNKIVDVNTKRKNIFIVVMCSIILLVLIGLIIVGIFAFRG